MPFHKKKHVQKMQEKAKAMVAKRMAKAKEKKSALEISTTEAPPSSPSTSSAPTHPPPSPSTSSNTTPTRSAMKEGQVYLHGNLKIFPAISLALL